MNLMPVRETEIAALYLRKGLFGKAVLRVQYHRDRARFSLNNDSLDYDRVGVGEWRDVNYNDTAELRKVIAFMCGDKQ